MLEKKDLTSLDRDDDTTTLDGAETSMDADEHNPLLGESRPDHFSDIKGFTTWRAIPKRISSAVIGTIRVVVTTVTAPVRYVIACFYDEEDRFSPFLPIITIYRVFSPRKRKVAIPASEKSDFGRNGRDRNGHKPRPQKRSKRPPSVASSSTAVATDSEFDEKIAPMTPEEPQTSRSTRSRSSLSSSAEEIAPSRRSIRIKLHNDEILRRRRQQQDDTPEAQTKEEVREVVAASLKSPSSPGGAKLKFPKAPTPPRPLIPRRQPSYNNASTHGPHAKTLVIDLDETLIHSHSKGGRFATGHMVEVKMHHTVGVGGTFLGPQIPILYYVHKRPHCDEFLRKVSASLNEGMAMVVKSLTRCPNGIISSFLRPQYKNMQTPSLTGLNLNGSTFQLDITDSIALSATERMSKTYQL
jgi:CTD nuclear envelope phosphatase 1